MKEGVSMNHIMTIILLLSIYFVIFPEYLFAENPHVYTDQDLEQYQHGSSSTEHSITEKNSNIKGKSQMPEEMSSICGDNTATKTEAMGDVELKENLAKISTIESVIKSNQMNPSLQYHDLEILRYCKKIYEIEVKRRDARERHREILEKEELEKKH
jgi:hypothetical protein